MSDHTWKPDSPEAPQFKAWDESGNLIGYTYSDGVLTFNRPPHNGITYSVESGEISLPKGTYEVQTTIQLPNRITVKVGCQSVDNDEEKHDA